MRRGLAVFGLGAAVVIGSWTGGAFAAEPAVKYTVRIEGVKGDLHDLLESVSRLKTFENKPPPTVAGVDRRARNDIEQLIEALRSEGYYDGRVSYELDRDQTPVRVTLKVEPGMEYVLSDFTVRYVGADGQPKPAPEGAVAPKVPVGMRARAPLIVADENGVITDFTRHGYPYAKAIDRKVVVDHRSHTVSVRADIDPGPLSRFGDVTVKGLTKLKEKFIHRRVPWKRGDVYDADLLDKFRTKLAGLGLFQSVTIEKAASPTADGHVPITITATEAKRRSIGGTAGYSTSEGFDGSVFWENRDLLGNGERLRITAEAAELRQGVTGDFQIPDFLRFDQNLEAKASALHEDTDAYESLGLTGLLALDRRLAKNVRGSLGVGPEFTEIKDDTGKTFFTLLGVPATLRYDSRDDVLNPTKGFRAALSLTPYLSFGKGQDVFLVSELNSSVYFPFDKKRVILAFRTRLGSITGSSTAHIPASKRLYAGGGGSIRGYNYQRVGPLDADGNPTGGRSVAEFSAEIRTRITKSIGLVPFVDAGNVFDASYPDFSKSLRWAAGLGLRYHTAAGPLRFDVAFPINRRPGIDNHFEVYISIGQAF